MRALAYDALMAPLGWAGLNAARRQLVEGLSGKVLEVGAGTGLALPAYPDTVASVTAVDVDLEALVRRARAEAAWRCSRRTCRRCRSRTAPSTRWSPAWCSAAWTRRPRRSRR
ncbi:hypothetical protein [Corallococcus sp. 4LFB]|uniref:hypothetical protein n=1 Tax=Corallococcus sp. 4LFB TaxID=3383249 RepID=UPI003974E05B